MERRFVKLGEKYYMVSATDNGLQLIPATQDHIADESLEQAIVGSEGDLGDNFLQKIIDEARAEMVEHLKNGLKITVLSMLGFRSEKWGNKIGFAVNSDSQLKGMVGEIIAAELKKILSEVKPEDLEISKKERERLREAYQKELMSRYEYAIKNDMWRRVESMAKADAEDVAKGLLKQRQETVGRIVLDKLFAPVKKAEERS